MSNEIRLFEEAAKHYFFSRKKIYFHNQDYKIEINSVDLKIFQDPARLSSIFCFCLETKDKDTENILTDNNHMNESREGGKISFNDMIYDCYNFDVIRDVEGYEILCGFRIKHIDIRRAGLGALVGEHYNGEEEKKINIKYNRFEIMDI